MNEKAPYIRIVICQMLFLSLVLFVPSLAMSETIRITGTGSSIGVMTLLAKEFQKRQAAVKVTILPSIGTTGGIKALKDDKIEIALTSRPLKPEEAGADLVEELYGRSPFVFATRQDNQVKGLTLAEIEKIYLGQQQVWTDKLPVRLVLRPMSDSYTAYLGSISKNMGTAVRKAHTIPGVFVAATDQDAADQIEKTPGSFGITSLSLILAEQRKISAIPINGVAPSVANLVAGKYPYSISLLIVYKKSRYGGAVKSFVDFIYSPEGQKIIRDNGLLPATRK
jgi:phosphate transport system substrate-binding protein